MRLSVKLLTAIIFLAITQLSIGQISSTAHDFTEKGWAPAENKMCSVCHTTHDGANVANAPLWNHEQTVKVYAVYSSASLDAESGTLGQPSGSSKLCLSCHDGTVALENFGGATGGTTLVTGGRLIGDGVLGLSTEHPISFTYDDALVGDDPGLILPSTGGTAIGGTIATDLLLSDKMECASCHDVHNKYNNTHLLKISNVNSELCLTCHDK